MNDGNQPYIIAVATYPHEGVNAQLRGGVTPQAVVCKDVEMANAPPSAPPMEIYPEPPPTIARPPPEPLRNNDYIWHVSHFIFVFSVLFPLFVCDTMFASTNHIMNCMDSANFSMNGSMALMAMCEAMIIFVYGLSLSRWFIIMIGSYNEARKKIYISSLLYILLLFIFNLIAVTTVAQLTERHCDRNFVNYYMTAIIIRFIWMFINTIQNIK